MPVRDQDLAGSQKVVVGGRHEIELGVVIIAPGVRPENLEALLDRQIRAANEHGVGKAVIARHPGAVAKSPGDDHRHHDGLAAPGGHLTGKSCQGLHRAVRHLPEEIEIGVGKLGVPAWLAPLTIATISSDFIQKDHRLRRFDLTEEKAPRPVLPHPVPEEILGNVRRPLPACVPPPLHVGAQLVHQDEVPPVFLQLQSKLSPPAVRVGKLVPVGGGPAALPERGAARLPVIFPVAVRFVVRLADDRALNGLDENGAVWWRCWHHESFSWRLSACNGTTKCAYAIGINFISQQAAKGHLF
jgi:hypothetical protein